MREHPDYSNLIPSAFLHSWPNVQKSTTFLYVFISLLLSWKLKQTQFDVRSPSFNVEVQVMQEFFIQFSTLNEVGWGKGVGGLVNACKCSSVPTLLTRIVGLARGLDYNYVHLCTFVLHFPFSSACAFRPVLPNHFCYGRNNGPCWNLEASPHFVYFIFAWVDPAV